MNEQTILLDLFTGIFVAALPLAVYFIYKYIKRRSERLDKEFKRVMSEDRTQQFFIEPAVQSGQDFLSENDVIVEEIIDDEEIEKEKPLQV
jgi:hypothetical protein